MEENLNSGKIVITTVPDEKNQKLPSLILLMLAAGTISGVVVSMMFFWSVDKLFGL